MKPRIHIFLGLVLVGVLRAGAAEAACSISATTVAFGNYNVLATTDLDSTGGVTIKCGMMENAITIRLSKGGATTFTPRRMVKSAEQLNYNLYLDASRTQLWGDTTGGTLQYGPSDPPDDVLFPITIYGRIPAGQDVTAGAYTDTVVATITW